VALLDDMKLLLRISNTAYDTEITDLINACESELILDGINEKIIDDFISDPTSDKLLKRIFSVYIKANFGWDNEDSEKLMVNYESLRNRLTLSIEYYYFVVTINTPEQQKVIFDGITKETNDSGTVIFYSRAKNHIEYIVNNTIYYVDITADKIIEVI